MVHSDKKWAEPLYTKTWHSLKGKRKAQKIKEDDFRYYTDILLMAATQAWRQYLKETDMEAATYLGELEAKATERGREEGREEGVRQAILTVLKARNLPIAEEVIDTIKNCHAFNTSISWLERSVLVKTVSEIFSQDS